MLASSVALHTPCICKQWNTGQ